MAKRQRPRRTGGTTRPGSPTRASGQERPRVPRPAGANSRAATPRGGRPRSATSATDSSGNSTGSTPSALRARVAQWSYPYLVRMHQLPRWVPVGALLALLGGGIFAPRWVGTACLAMVLVFLAWLTYLAWPEGGGTRRIIRVVALIFAAGATALRAFGG